MSLDNISGSSELTENIARRVYDDILRGDYALLGVYLPEDVLKAVARLTGEHMNSFGYNNGRAKLHIVSPLLSQVLDDVRDPQAPNRRWCVLAKNVAHIFEMTRGSLCGADLSGLDLTECDFSSAALSSMGLSAKLDNSLIRFDSFVRYRLPGLKPGQTPLPALDVSSDGRVAVGCGGLILRVDQHDPLRSRILCDISPVLGEGWSTCKLRFSQDSRCILVSATSDMDAFDRATSLHPYTEGYVPLRQWIYDGANLIACHGERESGAGAVLRPAGSSVSAYLESWELARFHERHCWELETGDPLRDELSARDRVFSGDLRYKLENGRISDRYTHRALTHIYAGPASRYMRGAGLCSINPTAAGCGLDRIHPQSPISAQELEKLRSRQEDQ